MIIFIDELDRCRPDFAIDILETIKHVFAIENVKFVLLANKKQLICSLRHRYGDQVDTKNYLDKFIKFTYTIPVHNQIGTRLKTIKNSITHCNNLIAEFNPDDGIDKLFEYIIETFSLSLREVENLVNYFKIYAVLSGINKDNLLCSDVKGECGYVWCMVIAITIIYFKPELSQKIINKSFDSDEIYIEFFNGDKSKIHSVRLGGGMMLYESAESVVIYISILINAGANYTPSANNENLADHLAAAFSQLFSSTLDIPEPYNHTLEIMQTFYGN